MTEARVPDSDEDDSDYVLDDTAADDDADDEEDEEDETLETGMSARHRSAVDALWKEMNADQGVMPGSGAAGREGNKSKGSKAKRKADRRAKKVLAGIFGKRTASSIIEGADSKKKRRGPKTDVEVSKRAQALADSRKVEISEVKKYAGQEITVKRVVTAVTANETAAAAVPTKAGLDSVIAAIDGPKAISTVTKSSMDWDKYKAEKGIEGEMEQITKDGKSYLNKQDFLQRCDVRRFENELEARQAKRDQS